MAADRDRGIEVRHAGACPSRDDGRCACRPSYRAAVHNPVTRRPQKSPWMRSLADARRWKRDAQRQIDDGELLAPTKETVAAALEVLVAGMKDGTVLDRSGRRYRPATRRRYETAARLHLIPALGRLRLAQVRRGDVQRVIDDLH